ncbi:MAG: D-tyrosyl-tRNA(Tyr) deacylase [Bacteroidetes bacterium]|nr:D-tyrosyl-tRNA(Tyr) deacylase [Bacteroidota bacterium]
MRAVIQRVGRASVSIENEVTGRIAKGMLILLGIEESDNEEDVDWLCGKLSRLRIFPDENGVMNLDIQAVGGAFLVVSQFTLHASTKKGNRPSYIRSARPETAIPLYEMFVEKLADTSGCAVQTGRFGAMMQVELVNEGPVTIIIDTKNKE